MVSQIWGTEAACDRLHRIHGIQLALAGLDNRFVCDHDGHSCNMLGRDYCCNPFPGEHHIAAPEYNHSLSMSAHHLLVLGHNHSLFDHDGVDGDHSLLDAPEHHYYNGDRLFPPEKVLYVDGMSSCIIVMMALIGLSFFIEGPESMGFCHILDQSSLFERVLLVHRLQR